jgi:hypothetical protein
MENLNSSEEQNSQIRVLDSIKSGDLKMRPKWLFATQTFLGVFAIVVIMLTLLYLASFIIFFCKQTGIWVGPWYGARGWYIFFRSLPWLLIIFLLVFIGLLELLVRRYSFLYSRPILYSILAILLIVVLGGYIVAISTPLHSRMSMYIEDHRLPPMGMMYRSYRREQVLGAYRGQIIEIGPRGFVLDIGSNNLIHVGLNRNTRVPSGAVFSTNTTVVVIGDQVGNEIRAFGVEPIQE